VATDAMTSNDRLERVGQEVAVSIVDALTRGLVFGQVDARLVEVDAHDVRHDAVEPPGEHALAAADVERVSRFGGYRVDDQRVVVDIVVPPLGLADHQCLPWIRVIIRRRRSTARFCIKKPA